MSIFLHRQPHQHRQRVWFGLVWLARPDDWSQEIIDSGVDTGSAGLANCRPDSQHADDYDWKVSDA